MSKKKKSLLARIISVLLGVVLVVAAIAVGGYFYLKNYLGIDVIDIKNKVDLLNRPVSESNVVTNGFTDNDIANAFLKISGNSDVYSKDAEGKYQFNKELYENGSLQVDCYLNDKEIAGVVATIIKNYTFSELQIDEQFNELIEIKEISFSSLTNEVDYKTVEFSYTICVNLNLFKKEIENAEFVSLINKYIPNNIYIKSDVAVDINETNSKNYSISDSSIYINELSLEDSQKVLTLFDFVDNDNFSGMIVNEVNSTICNFLFGNDSFAGLLNSFNGSSSFQFVLDNDEVLLSIKK